MQGVCIGSILFLDLWFELSMRPFVLDVCLPHVKTRWMCHEHQHHNLSPSDQNRLWQPRESPSSFVEHGSSRPSSSRSSPTERWGTQLMGCLRDALLAVSPPTTTVMHGPSSSHQLVHDALLMLDTLRTFPLLLAPRATRGDPLLRWSEFASPI